METRFRIRTREGEELRPRTMEIFAEFVRSGVVRSEDLVYDALTGEWTPAGAHPMVRLMLDPLVTEGDVAEAEEVPPLPSDPLLDGALKLVDAPEVSPEEAAQAFIARMEDERRADPDEPALSREVPLVMDVGASPSSVEAESEPEPEPEPAPVTAPPVRPRPRRPVRPAAVPVALAEPHEESRSWRHIGLLGLAAALSVSALALFAAVAHPSARVGDRMPDLAESTAAAARMPRRVNNTEEAVRSAAYDGFVTSVDGLRQTLDVGPVPAEWLTGKYLSDPKAYPEVRRYWERYMSYVEHARAEEVNLYREAYLHALDEAGATGPVRSLRLATALGDFSSGDSARGESYAHAWDLAAAALALHDTLMGLDGRVSYEPARGSRVSADPVVEAAGKDSDAQVLLDNALDRVLKALQVNDGAIEPGVIPGWLARSLRDAKGESVPRE